MQRNREIESKCPARLAVDAVAVRPTTTMTEDAIIEGLDNVDHNDRH
jgi:hypothetical protein